MSDQAPYYMVWHLTSGNACSWHDTLAGAEDSVEGIAEANLERGDVRPEFVIVHYNGEEITTAKVYGEYVATNE